MCTPSKKYRGLCGGESDRQRGLCNSGGGGNNLTVEVQIGCLRALIYVPHHFKGQLCIYEDELSAQTLDFTE